MISSTGTPQRPSGWLRPRAVESSDAKQAAASSTSATPCSGCAWTALDAAAGRLELREQRVFLGRRELVAAGMRDHGHAARRPDPAHRVAELGPAMLDVAGLAFGEVAAEDGVHVGHDAVGHQVAAEMRARD